MSIIKTDPVQKTLSSTLAMSLRGDSKIFRFASLAGATIIITSLFWLGAKPVAIGLFPPPLDKIAHFSTFGLIAAMLWFSLFRGRPWLVIALVSLVGAADEIHQIFLPGRSAGLDDWTADIFAAVVITALLEFTRRQER